MYWYVTLELFPQSWNVQAEAKILRGPHEDLESYLEAIVQIKDILNFFNSNKNYKSNDSALTRVNNLLSKAISKLEDEFKQILAAYRFVFHSFNLEVDCLCLKYKKKTLKCMFVMISDDR